MMRIGPAGWSYSDWSGIVYPRQKPRGFDPLAYLTRYFDTIEVNSTFYRPATLETAAAWIDRVSGNPRFRFTAKMYRRFTHERKEAWTRTEAREVRLPLDRLLGAGRLGAVLLQFPWSFRNADASRSWLDDLVSTFSDLPLVVEIRHESWNDPAFFEHLHERGVGFVNIDQPQFHDSIKPSARSTSPIGYIRVHGRNYQDWWRKSAEPHERYDYLYTPQELRPWAARAKKIEEDEGTEDVYVVTNNHYKGKAVANALMLKSMTGGKKVPGPPELFEEYGDTLKKFAVADAEGPAGRAA